MEGDSRKKGADCKKEGGAESEGKQGKKGIYWTETEPIK